ncbi:MAG: nucleotidyltransferase family protein [Acidimicrobiales bacterium]
MRSVAVVLAAGGGERFSGPQHKLLSQFRGRPLITWALDGALGAGLGATIVVVGAVELSRLLPAEVTVVVNERWREGQATSLQAGIGWARSGGFDAAVVGLGDQPLVPSEAWRLVAASRFPLAIASFQGARMPPARLSADVWHLLAQEGDVGARSVMADHPEMVEEIACPGQPIDIDTLEDMGRWS